MAHLKTPRSSQLTLAPTAETILDAWRAGKAPDTMRSYVHDLDAFARFLSTGLAIVPPLSIDAALDRLFREERARAHGIVLQFRASLLDTNLAPASINRALATLLVYRDEHDRSATQRQLTDLVAATLSEERERSTEPVPIKGVHP